jgi:TRAP-type transport system periplasmic protein
MAFCTGTIKNIFEEDIVKEITVKLFACLMLLALLGVAACSSSPTSPATAPTVSAPATTAAPTSTKTWNLKLSHEQAPTAMFNVNGWEPWARDVERVTNGRVKITIYPSQTLMKTTEAWEGVKSGIADLSWTGTGMYPGKFTFLDSVTLPFIVPSGEVSSRVVWSLYQKFPELQSRLEEVKILAVFSTDPYMFVSSKKNYKTMDDFKGQTLRMNSGQPTEMMKLLGGTPTFFAFADLYMNLEKGVIDGCAAPAEAIGGFRMYEPAPYLTYVPLTTSVQIFFMNKNVWNDMPKDIQDAIMSVSGEAMAIRMGRDVFDRVKADLSGIAKAANPKVTEYTVPESEWMKWSDIAGKPLWGKWVKDEQAKGLTSAQQILDETIKLSKQYSAK